MVDTCISFVVAIGKVCLVLFDLEWIAEEARWWTDGWTEAEINRR